MQNNRTLHAKMTSFWHLLTVSADHGTPYNLRAEGYVERVRLVVGDSVEDYRRDIWNRSELRIEACEYQPIRSNPHTQRTIAYLALAQGTISFNMLTIPIKIKIASTSSRNMLNADLFGSTPDNEAEMTVWSFTAFGIKSIEKSVSGA